MVLVKLVVAAALEKRGPLALLAGSQHAEAHAAATEGSLSDAPFPPLDFTRATLAQRKGPAAIKYWWR